MRLLPLTMLLSIVGVQAAPNDCCCYTREIELCFVALQEKAEVELNAVYSRALKNLSEPDEPLTPNSATKRKLVAAQRAWVAFRKADCDAWGQRTISGTARGIEYVSCMLQHAERRINDLKAYAPQ